MKTIYTFLVMLGTVIAGLAVTCVCVELVRKPKYEDDDRVSTSSPIILGVNTTESGTIRLPGDPFNNTWILPIVMPKLPYYIEDKEAFLADYGKGIQQFKTTHRHHWHFLVFVMALQLSAAYVFVCIPFILHKPECTQNYVMRFMEEGRLVFDKQNNLVGIIPPLREWKNYGVYCIPGLLCMLISALWVLPTRCSFHFLTTKRSDAAHGGQEEKSPPLEGGGTNQTACTEQFSAEANDKACETQGQTEVLSSNAGMVSEVADHKLILEKEEKEKNNKGGYEQWLKTDANGHLVVLGYKPRVSLDVSFDHEEA